jgi:NADPH2:quinone reductase
VVFDTVGGKVLEQSFPATAVYGDVVTILQPAADIDWAQARKRNLRISLEFMLAPTLLDLHDALAHHGEILREAAQRFDSGALRIAVAAVLPLDQAAESHRRLEQDHPTGKLVLSVD